MSERPRRATAMSQRWVPRPAGGLRLAPGGPSGSRRDHLRTYACGPVLSAN